jgi:hypothetical protein
VRNHLLAGPADDDDVVIRPRTVFDERDDRPPAIEVLPDPIADRARGGAEGERLPAAMLDGSREHIGVNSGGAPIHEFGEVFCVDLSLTPVTQHHRDGRSAAEVFRL